MPVIYYTVYKPLSESVAEISRKESRLGRLLLAKGLSDLYGLPYDPEKKEPAVLCSDNGKPYLADHPDIFFNITHCPGLVACAFCSSPVGVDAEPVGYFPEILIRRALTDDEQSILRVHGTTEDLRNEWFCRFWTLKEAYVKWTGVGVDTDLKAFSFGFGLPDGASDNYTVYCSDPEACCFQTKLESGHIVSLCTDQAERESLIVCDII